MTLARSRSAALRGLAIAGLAGMMLLSSTGPGADAPGRPRSGGELLYVVPTEPASYDGHREGTFALIHPLAPVYGTGNNYGRYVDKTLDDLYQKQSRALDFEEQKKWVRDFERRLLDEEAHYFYTLQWHRIIPHSAKMHGWTITPSHFVNNQLDGVWLSE